LGSVAVLNRLSVPSLYVQNISVTTQLSTASLYSEIASIGSLTVGSLTVLNRLSVPTLYATNISITQISTASLFDETGSIGSLTVGSLAVLNRLSVPTLYVTNISTITQISTASIFAAIGSIGSVTLGSVAVLNRLSVPLLYVQNVSVTTQLSAASLFAANASIGSVTVGSLAVLNRLSVPSIFVQNVSVTTQLSTASLFVGTASMGSVTLGSVTILNLYAQNISTTVLTALVALSASQIYGSKITVPDAFISTAKVSTIHITNAAVFTVLGTSSSVTLCVSSGITRNMYLPDLNDTTNLLGVNWYEYTAVPGSPTWITKTAYYHRADTVVHNTTTNENLIFYITYPQTASGGNQADYVPYIVDMDLAMYQPGNATKKVVVCKFVVYTNGSGTTSMYSYTYIQQGDAGFGGGNVSNIAGAWTGAAATFGLNLNLPAANVYITLHARCTGRNFVQFYAVYT
jgi:hypothetical protein